MLMGLKTPTSAPIPSEPSKVGAILRGFLGFKGESVGEIMVSGRQLQNSHLRTAGIFLVGLCFVGHWSGEALGQQTPAREIRPPVHLQTEQTPPVQALELFSPNATPAALPITAPSQPLGERLASCDQAAGNSSESLVLPGQRGEVRLDRCFRGRDHLVCSFNVLLT